jgi:hypothetical protein
MSMTPDEMAAIINRIEYKPDWELRLRTTLHGDMFLQVSFEAVNPETGLTERWTGRKWQLSSHMVEAELVQPALMAVLAAEEHEAREAFKFDGLAIFGPHINLDALKNAATQLTYRREDL